MAQAGSSTAALQPSASNTKRLSTHPSVAGKAPVNNTAAVAGPSALAQGKEVLSPGELCGFVDTLLSQLETRFDEMSEQVLGRMNEMSSRIDNLENTIHDLMNSDIDTVAMNDKAAPAGAGTGSVAAAAAR